MTHDEEFLDNWVLGALRRRGNQKCDFHDFFTMSAIDDKWGAETPVLLANSQTCKKYLSESLERLLDKKLLRRLEVPVGQTFYELCDPLESFTRQVHEK